MKVAVLAVQGAFIEHEQMLQTLGVETVELRKKSDLKQDFQGLILPGGESTVQGKLLEELGMKKEIQNLIQEGMPVLGTCAGLILLARHLVNDERTYLGTLPVKVHRNGYGRQLGSFSCEESFDKIEHFPMRFIRAPFISSICQYGHEEEVEVLATIQDRIVGVKYQNQMGLSFHPELTNDTRIHEQFMKMIRSDYTDPRGLTK